MEEILASIRRIISEDEPPAAPEAFEAPAAPEPALAAAPAPAPAAVHAEPAQAETHDDVLELTERVPEPAALETHGDLDVLSASPEPPAAAREPAPAPAAAPVAADETLLSPPAAEAAALAFGQLSKSLLMPAEGRTLEDVVRELLRPLLKAWLDEHLPGIVQAAVTEEVERVSRRRV